MGTQKGSTCSLHCTQQWLFQPVYAALLKAALLLILLCPTAVGADARVRSSFSPFGDKKVDVTCASASACNVEDAAAEESPESPETLQKTGAFHLSTESTRSARPPDGSRTHGKHGLVEPEQNQCCTYGLVPPVQRREQLPRGSAEETDITTPAPHSRDSQVALLVLWLHKVDGELRAAARAGCMPHWVLLSISRRLISVSRILFPIPDWKSPQDISKEHPGGREREITQETSKEDFLKTKLRDEKQVESIRPHCRKQEEWRSGVAPFFSLLSSSVSEPALSLGTKASARAETEALVSVLLYTLPLTLDNTSEPVAREF